jgi:hypothetical protein
MNPGTALMEIQSANFDTKMEKTDQADDMH